EKIEKKESSFRAEEGVKLVVKSKDEDQHRHDVTVSLLEKGKTVDKVESYAAMRKISKRKDAAASAIYGARAAAGVVLVTTKKGTAKGKAISDQVKQEIAAEVNEIVAAGGKRPHLAAIL
ncbi:hypothetical protein D0T85_22195, partial [Bacteroides sp. 519]|nr:hypothetical protein [Bacteroides sp. 519]